MSNDLPFGALQDFETADGGIGRLAALSSLEEAGLCTLAELPYSIRVLLEAALRRCD